MNGWRMRVYLQNTNSNAYVHSQRKGKKELGLDDFARLLAVFTTAARLGFVTTTSVCPRRRNE